MLEKLDSNNVEIRSVKKLKGVLNSYVWEKNVKVAIEKKGSGWTLKFRYDGRDGHSCNASAVAVVKLVDLPDPSEYPNEDDYRAAKNDVYRKKGEEGFLALLRDLAQYLKSQLMINLAGVSELGFRGGSGELTLVPRRCGSMKLGRSQYGLSRIA